MAYIGTEPKDIRSFGRTKFDYTATQGQTAFTGADDDGKVLAFTVGQIEVYVNGILMDESDFTTTGTGTVTLATAANLNDVINIVSFETNIPDSNYVPATGGTFTGDVDFGANKITYANIYAQLSDLPSASTYHGMFAHVHATGLAYYAHAGAWIPLANLTGANFTGNLAVNNASGSQVTLHRPDTTIVNDDLYGQIILSGDDADTNASGTRGYIRGRSQGSGGGLKMEFGTAAGGLAIGDPRMVINADGYVTKPNQPSFLVNLSSSKNISGSATIEITGWDIAQGSFHNTGSHFNLTSGRFTAPVAGKYKFDANLMHGVTTGDFQLHIRVNGGTNTAVKANDMNATSGNTWQQTSVTALFNLAANDYVSMFVYNSATMSYAAYGNSGGHCFTTFNGYLVG